MVQPVDRWALAGAAALLAVGVADAATGERVVLVPALLLGPLIAAIGAGPVRTAAVTLAATLLTLPLGELDGIFGTRDHAVFITLVAAGGLLAAVVAGVRARQEERTRRTSELLATELEARVRSEYLARVGRLLEAPPEPDAMLRATTALAIPDMADLCIVDLLEDGELRGLAVEAVDAAVASAVRQMRAKHPIRVGSKHPVGRCAATAEPVLVAWIDDGAHRTYTEDADQATWLAVLGYRSALVAPLVARGRLLGVLSLVRLGDRAEPYDREDLDVVCEVARRAGLALDSARLFHELLETEGRLEAILTNLAEAVTVHRPDGELVFANEAAAELLGFASAEELTRTPTRDLQARFVVLDDQGRPLDPLLLPSRQALTGVASPEPLLTRTIDRRSGVERWVLTKARRLLGSDGDVAYAVSVMEDVTDSRRSEREQRLLAAASKLLHSSLDVELTLEKAAWAAVPELADWCCVDVPDERGRLVRRALAAADPERRAALDAFRDAVELRPDDAASPGRALVDLQPRLLEELGDEDLRRLARDARGLDALRRAAVRSMLVVPLVAGDRAIGLMTLGTDTPGRRLRPDDLAVAAELGRRAGIAVENARVHATRTQIAMTLQRSLLPPRLPVIPGLTIAARFRAAGTDEAERVGGDFYDLFPSGDGWFVVIGDVTGKGPEAAAITSLARYTMRTAAVYEPSPAQVLRRLNTALAADPDRRRLCTAICARVAAPAEDGGPVEVVLACAGHPPPMLLTDGGAAGADGSAAGADGRASGPVAVAGPLLGAFEDITWTEHRLELPAGEALLLYTDGVIDSRGTDGRFGLDRLEALCGELAGGDADAIAEGVDAALRAFEDGPQRDDVALLVLRAGSGDGAAAGASVVAEAPAGPLAGGL